MAKAKKIPFLDPNKPLDECVKKILRTRFDEMVSYEQGTLDGSDIEALHDMRVASRRVQAVLKIFRGLFHKKKFRAEYGELRTLIRSLGEVRDYDVFIDKLEKLKAEPDGDVPKPELGNKGKNRQGSKDNRAIELLIIRKKAERDMKRKLLVQHINTLNRAGYKGHFSRFIEESM